MTLAYEIARLPAGSTITAKQGLGFDYRAPDGSFGIVRIDISRMTVEHATFKGVTMRSANPQTT